jgi:ribosome recycling factor
MLRVELTPEERLEVAKTILEEITEHREPVAEAVQDALESIARALRYLQT